MKTFNKVSVLLGFFVLAVFGLTKPMAVHAATAKVDLLSADGFAILAGTPNITDVANSSVITGNVGLSPATGASIGLLCSQVTGTIYSVDAFGPVPCAVENASLLTTAKNDLGTAYDDAVSRTAAATVVNTELGGTTKFAGVYKSAATTFQITSGAGHLVLDAQNDPSAVFIFEAAAAGTGLTVGNGSTVELINGAQACNVFWRVETATIGTTAVFKGNILALTSITVANGAGVSGRLLARNGSVTLDHNTVVKAACSAAAVTPASGATSRMGTINVVKTVINDNGGTKTVADFPLFVNGTSVISGQTNVFPAPAASYFITETSDPNYTRTFSGDCDSTGRLDLNININTFCIVTNNDIGAPVVPVVPPLIDVVKVPSPLALPLGPGPVTYTYTVRNIGTVPMTDVTMVGDTCSPIVLQSGDTNGDSKLDVNETWIYTCTVTLSETHTNTVVATGWANGISAVDIASANVIVGLPVVPPLIHVTKIPNPLALSAGGGVVTYTNKVTNPGIVALSNVRLTDDKCASVRFVSGDTNGNSKLDVNETWTYTCSQRLTKTTVNTVVAEGDANGLTARDFAIATVVVAVPVVPNTGVAPVENNSLWNIVIPAGVLSVSVLFYIIRRKQIV